MSPEHKAYTGEAEGERAELTTEQDQELDPYYSLTPAQQWDLYSATCRLGRSFDRLSVAWCVILVIQAILLALAIYGLVIRHLPIRSISGTEETSRARADNTSAAMASALARCAASTALMPAQYCSYTRPLGGSSKNSSGVFMEADDVTEGE